MEGVSITLERGTYEIYMVIFGNIFCHRLTAAMLEVYFLPLFGLSRAVGNNLDRDWDKVGTKQTHSHAGYLGEPL